jgi:hypothetical protein
VPELDPEGVPLEDSPPDPLLLDVASPPPPSSSVVVPLDELQPMTTRVEAVMKKKRRMGSSVADARSTRSQKPPERPRSMARAA